MVIAFGLFSMPPGGINKQPNVDYHVWMDQQMNVVANHPVMADMAGLNWWTTILADEETVRFVGKLYRHYAIEGKTEMLTQDPLFLTHIQNADFEKGLEGWTLQPAEEGTIQAKSFPRYGRIEGRYMGLGRPADPEHIGDTFLWMKRSENGPNMFSQTIKDLEPGRLYSMKMFTCDYKDLINPKKKTLEEANPFIGRVALEGVELDTKRSFTETYASNPEPPIPVWITYHWKVFRAKGPTAKLTVSDWPGEGSRRGRSGRSRRSTSWRSSLTTNDPGWPCTATGQGVDRLSLAIRNAVAVAAGDVARPAVVDQVDAPQPAVPAPELLQRRDVVVGVVRSRHDRPHPPGVDDQEHQQVDRAVPGVLELPLLDRAGDRPGGSGRAPAPGSWASRRRRRPRCPAGPAARRWRSTRAPSRPAP